MFKGIEELSLIDTDIYWRNTLIASVYDAWHGHTDQIVERCRHLERIGVPISAAAATTYWTWFRDLPANHSYKPLLIALVGARIYEHQDGRQLAFVHMEAREVTWFDGRSWQRFPLLEDDDGELIDQRWDHFSMQARGFITPQVLQPRFKDASSAPLEGMMDLFLRYAIPNDFFDRIPCQEGRVMCTVEPSASNLPGSINFGEKVSASPDSAKPISDEDLLAYLKANPRSSLASLCRAFGIQLCRRPDEPLGYDYTPDAKRLRRQLQRLRKDNRVSSAGQRWSINEVHP